MNDIPKTKLTIQGTIDACCRLMNLNMINTQISQDQNGAYGRCEHDGFRFDLSAHIRIRYESGKVRVKLEPHFHVQSAGAQNPEGLKIFIESQQAALEAFNALRVLADAIEITTED